MNRKLLKRIIIFIILIIIVEAVIMSTVKLIKERKIDRVNTINDLLKVDDGYIAVGVSDFHDSKMIKEKFYEYTDKNNKKQRFIAIQARIAKYDDDMHLVWENTYENSFDSSFTSLIKVDDGYIVVGSYISDYEDLKRNTSKALIIKFDLNGKEIWKNTYSALDNSKFNKIIDDDGKYIVIGQSVYKAQENDESILGGGVIVQYNELGKEIAHNNYGGNRSGKFNDIINVDDGYIVCGRDASNYGIVVKFRKDFQRDEKDLNKISNKVVWQKTYANTNNEGFTSLILLDNKLYLAGAIKEVAGIIVYDVNGRYISKILSNINNRFNSILYSDNSLYLSTNDSIIKYDIKGNKFINIKETNYNLNKIISLNNKIAYIGTKNDQCTLLGCDYQNLFEYLTQ